VYRVGKQCERQGRPEQLGPCHEPCSSGHAGWELWAVYPTLGMQHNCRSSAAALHGTLPRPCRTCTTITAKAMPSPQLLTAGQ